MSLALLSLLACRPDPMEHPDLRPASEGPLRIELQAAPEGLRVGAPIPITARVTARPDSPTTNFEARDNSLLGRAGSDRWTVRLKGGWSDPSPWWQDTAPRRMVSMPHLVSPEAELLWELPLHDWVRFDQAGSYAVQLETDRAAGDIVVRSNPLPLTIGARDTAADATERKAVLEALASAGTAERVALFRRLAVIGDKETLDLALQRLSDDDPTGWVLVLVTHPFAEAALSGVEGVFASADGAVGMGHIRAYEGLAYDAEFAEPMAPAPKRPDAPTLDAHRVEVAKRAEVRVKAGEAAWTKLRAGLEGKTGEARATSLGTAAVLAFRKELPDEESLWPILQGELASVPDAVIVELLGRYYDDFYDPALVPALVTLVSDDTATVAARSMGLRRLTELDPSAGHDVIKPLVANPARPVTDADEALRSLPSVSDATQKAIIAGLATANDRVQQARLLGEYVSVDHLEAVEAAWKNEPAEVETGVLAGYAAYFQNHAPGKAAPLLSRFGPDRYTLLEEIAPMLDDPTTLNPIAMQGLWSTHQGVNFKSSDYIIDYGTADLKSELIRRIPRTGKDPIQQQGLVAAICAARAWLLDEAERQVYLGRLTDRRSDATLRSIETKDQIYTVLTTDLKAGVPEIKINYRQYVGREAIVEKLSQFQDGLEIKLLYKGQTPEEGIAMWTPIFEEANLKLYTLGEE